MVETDRDAFELVIDITKEKAMRKNPGVIQAIALASIAEAIHHLADVLEGSGRTT